MKSYIKTASVMASGELRLSHPLLTNPVQRNCPHGIRVSPAAFPKGDVIYQPRPINDCLAVMIMEMHQSFQKYAFFCQHVYPEEII